MESELRGKNTFIPSSQHRRTKDVERKSARIYLSLWRVCLCALLRRRFDPSHQKSIIASQKDKRNRVRKGWQNRFADFRDGVERNKLLLMERWLMEGAEWKVANQQVLCISPHPPPSAYFSLAFISRQTDRPLEKIENMEIEEAPLHIINFILYSIEARETKAA